METKKTTIGKLRGLANHLPKPIEDGLLQSYRSLNNIKSRVWWKVYLAISNKKENLIWTKAIKENSPIMKNTKDFIARQFNNRDENLNRYDIIVRYLAIDKHYNGSSEKIKHDLYEKMQLKRDKEYISKDRILSLVRSIKEKGYDEKSSILVNRLQQLVDGSHRSASALYLDQKQIPIIVHGYNEKVEFGIDWFKKNDFTSEEIQYLKKMKDEIFIEKGILFPLILWPTIQNHFNEIEKKLMRKYRVAKTQNILLEDLSKFTKELYTLDDIPMWQINQKIKGMEGKAPNIKILYIEIPKPKFRKNENGKKVSTTLEGLKSSFRKTYSKKANIKDFYIMHSPDNFEDNQEAVKIIKKHATKKNE
ncbi:ParB/RepB/Spo0J family partition protein [archaeon]|nr:ParB/RepB/Spo0J family partition protein [archaeon]